MNKGTLIFSQVMDYLPLHEFRKCVKRYGGDYKIKSFSCLDQFLCMAFAQLTYRSSLRDIEACLRSMKGKLYHMGIRGKVSRNTLAHANQTRDHRIYADFSQILIHEARKLYAQDDFGLELDNTVYALDATIIDLCLSSFRWAKRINHLKDRAAIKLQVLLDLRGNIPCFLQVDTPGGIDASVLDDLIVEAGSFYIMDKGYIDTLRLYNLHRSLAYFVIRLKKNLLFKRIYSRSVDKSTGLRCDQIIRFTGQRASENYPDRIRRICYYDSDKNVHLELLTNNLDLPAFSITQLYKCRWQVELFFKWIKQHLRIKSFFGTSLNAVKAQIWIAISTYVIVSIIKKKAKLDQDLYTILQILSVTIFEKDELYQVLTRRDYTRQTPLNTKQLELFEL